jgi:membrane peptidoglycan carboxypeptidase
MSSVRSRSVWGTFRRLATLVLVSGFAGVLVVGLALPFAAGLGFVARESAAGFQSLPADVELGPLAERSRIVDADGATLATFYFENRTYVPLEKIAPVMIDATLAIEDHRFYDHGPIDLRGTVRAFVGNVEAGEVTGGGSTLTQQYAKLLRESQAESDEEAAAATAESYGRKLHELRLAIDIERELSKDEILERYLNIAYYGASAYGIEEAARRYFSTSAADLTLAQAAMLAGLVQRPSGYDPTQNPEAAQSRRNVVLHRMVQLDLADPEEAAQARESDLGLELGGTRNGCPATWAPFYCQYVENELLDIEELGETRDERSALLRRGGLTIETTLDRVTQQAAQEAVTNRVAPTDDSMAAVGAVEPGSGAIRAVAHSREYGDGEGQTHINYAVDQAMGGGLGYQAGSTFKSFVLAAAIQQGISLNTPIDSPQELDAREMVVSTCEGTTTDPKYQPTNSTGSGTFSLRQATERSVNTYFIQLVEETGICDPWTIATRSGLNRGDGTALAQFVSFPLGSDNVSPLSMAEAYAMFAARGVHCDSYAITRVLSRDGEVLFEREPSCEQVMDERHADAVNDVLRGVIETPGATGNRMRLNGRPAAGKTGTTNGSVAIWWAGYTPDLSAAVVVSDPDPDPNDPRKNSLEGRTFNGERLQVCGGCIPGPIWKQMMDAALAGKEAMPFVPPESVVIDGVTSRVPDVRGLDADEARDVLSAAGFRVRVDDTAESDVPAGQVVSTDPAPWAWVSSGTEIGMTISAGSGDDDDDEGDDEEDRGRWPRLPGFGDDEDDGDDPGRGTGDADDYAGEDDSGGNGNRGRRGLGDWLGSGDD